MHSRFSLIAVASLGTLLCVACTVNRTSPYPTTHASETLEIRVSQAQVDSTAAALRQAVGGDSHAHGASILIATRPDYLVRPHTVEARADVYVEALEDARIKAQTIATKEHMALGQVQSIQEMLAGPTGPYSPLKGAAQNLSMVRVSPNQPVILFVAYSLGAGGSQPDLPHVISVYGVSPAQDGQLPYEYQNQNGQQIIAIDINANDKNLADATAAVATYESLIRQTLAQMKVPASAIRVTRSETFSP